MGKEKRMEDLKLRTYQKEDVDFIVNRRQGRVYLASDPGTGKTAEALTAMMELTQGLGKVLIVGTKVSLGTWSYEAERWFGLSSFIYAGTPKKRKNIWNEFNLSNSRLLIINYKMCKEVNSYNTNWSMIIADEIHKGGLLNHKTDTWEYFKEMQSRYLILITGTPVRQGPQDLWAPLHLLDAKRFPAYWPFVNKHCIVNKEMFGKTIEGRPKDVKAFNEMVFTYMIRRLKKDVLPELPDKLRQAIPMIMDEKQQKLYDDLLENMYLELPDKEILVTPNVATNIIRLRQLLVTPQIFGYDMPGIGIETLLELVEEEFDAGRAVGICTPFRGAVPFIVEAMRSLTSQIFEIHGQIKKTAKEVSLEFQAVKTHKKIIVYTVKSGMSWDAYTASTCFFLGAEWGAYDNLQAEDRLHRMGQTNNVHIKYLLCKNTVDDLVMARLDDKQMAENWILRPEEVLAALHLKREKLLGRSL